MGNDQTQQGTGGISVLCISRSRLRISAGDALAQRDIFRLNGSDTKGETGVRRRARLSDHTPMLAETSPAKDLALFNPYWKSREVFREKGNVWASFSFEPYNKTTPV